MHSPHGIPRKTLAACDITISIHCEAKKVPVYGKFVPLGLIETTHFLIEHVAMVHRVVHEGGGIVQNFTGDGVLALWLGTEMHPRETALRALAAAADLAVQVAASNAWRRSHSLLTRRVRIGLHTGEVMFVNDHQRNFSFVVGPEVNFARRVEQAGKKVAMTLTHWSWRAGQTLHRADLCLSFVDRHGFHRLTADQLGTLRDKVRIDVAN
jgi:class 3 adenylate cyclase